jgi:hypothetical protein
MPRGDQTSPIGLSPRTGRGLGYCGGHDVSWFEEQYFGRRWRRRGGQGGQDWQNRFSAPSTEETLQILKSEAVWLKARLEAINKSIEVLEK